VRSAYEPGEVVAAALGPGRRSRRLPADRLLWKSRGPRARGDHDLDVTHAALLPDERRWLLTAITTAHPDPSRDVRRAPTVTAPECRPTPPSWLRR